MAGESGKRCVSTSLQAHPSLYDEGLWCRSGDIRVRPSEIFIKSQDDVETLTIHYPTRRLQRSPLLEDIGEMAERSGRINETGERGSDKAEI